MEKFTEYNQRLTEEFNKLKLSGFTDDIDKALCSNLVDQHLRASASIETLRKAGSFFTGDELADELVSNLENININSRIMDPTCGAGNLLLACTKRLPVNETLSGTLKEWGSILYGYDLVKEFVEATKIRIIFECIRRKVQIDIDNINDAKSLLCNINVRNALDSECDYNKYSHIVMNPPFTLTKLNDYKFWKGGKVNIAAVIYDKVVCSAKLECQISAILPEVLRSGSRYEEWRKSISERITAKIDLKGRFDRKTDVDVFIMFGTKKDRNTIKWKPEGIDISVSTIGDLFHVSVGPLVSYRSAQIGELYPYIYPKMLKAWSEIKSFDSVNYRRFSGRVVTPPFVVVKRTSSPSDIHRASATLINGHERVAVENHLIIIKPLENAYEMCKQLITQLKDPETTNFLNQRIRCRHLTVSSVKDIPFIKGKFYD